MEAAAGGWLARWRVSRPRAAVPELPPPLESGAEAPSAAAGKRRVDFSAPVPPSKRAWVVPPSKRAWVVRARRRGWLASLARTGRARGAGGGGGSRSRGGGGGGGGGGEVPLGGFGVRVGRVREDMG